MRDELLKQIDRAVEAGMDRIVDGGVLHAISELLTLKLSVLMESGTFYDAPPAKRTNAKTAPAGDEL